MISGLQSVPFILIKRLSNYTLSIFMKTTIKIASKGCNSSEESSSPYVLLTETDFSFEQKIQMIIDWLIPNLRPINFDNWIVLYCIWKSFHLNHFLLTGWLTEWMNDLTENENSREKKQQNYPERISKTEKSLSLYNEYHNFNVYAFSMATN